jgi:O-methyltransferase involved in polyketide biosynthesis
MNYLEKVNKQPLNFGGDPMKIQLKNEMETLIIPLYGKAKMSQIGIFKDPYAEAMIEKIDYDYAKLKIQEKTKSYRTMFRLASLFKSAREAHRVFVIKIEN